MSLWSEKEPVGNDPEPATKEVREGIPSLEKKYVGSQETTNAKIKFITWVAPQERNVLYAIKT